MSTHYETLHVGRDAPVSVIKSAYRALVKDHHPDRGGLDAARMSRINEAYAVLTDPDSRRAYDESLTGQETEASTAAGDNNGTAGTGWGTEQPWKESAPPPPPPGPGPYAPPTGQPYTGPPPGYGNPAPDIPRYQPQATFVAPRGQMAMQRERALPTPTVLWGQGWASRSSGLVWATGSLTIIVLSLVTAPSLENLAYYVLGMIISIRTGLTRIRRGRLSTGYVVWNGFVVLAAVLIGAQLSWLSSLPIWLWWLALVLAVETRAREMRRAWT